MSTKIAILGLGLTLLSAVSIAQTPVQGKSKQMLNGKKVYDMYCQACHQADGNGVPRLNPPLAGTVYVTGSKTRLIDIVLKGLSDPLEINGEEYNNPMAAHSFLTDQQIADVLTYIRNSFGNKADIVTVAEVKKQRAKK
ncbi:c-type cytochrome [Sediminibacterium sp.]|uniref:c-type cytochrome n=1 Tax=Sediminibacterium sp. TaxID=1917865 RepID=UPI003F71CDB8